MLASIFGAVGGNALAADDQARAEQALRDALAAYQGIKLPSIEEQRIALQDYQTAGELTPQLEAALQLGPSAMEGISTDPRLRDVQMKALSQLQDMGNTGLTATDRAALMEVRRQVAGDRQAADASILQNMAQRGVGGSGAELAARLNASQAGMNRASEEGDRLAAMAQQRGLESIAQAGSLGGQLRSQDYGEKSDIAKSKDIVNQFNITNSQNVGARNAASANAGKQFNITNKQNTLNKNTEKGNQQEIFNKGLPQQQYQNELARAGGIAGGHTNMAGYFGNEAQATRNMYAGIGKGADEAGYKAAGSASMFSDRALKKNVKNAEGEIEEFMDAMKPKSFQYKDSSHGEGDYLGVLAQDVEKSDLGKDMVDELPEGKAIDLTKAYSAILAGQADLHKRLKDIEKKR